MFFKDTKGPFEIGTEPDILKFMETSNGKQEIIFLRYCLAYQSPRENDPMCPFPSHLYKFL